jgi:hypothetical protein
MMMRNQSPSNVKALIDADMLRYEVGFGVEFKEGDSLFIHNFDSAIDLLQHKIDVIVELSNSDMEPTLFLTSDKKTAQRHKEVYVPNFRDALAVTKPYKGNRENSKPFHFDNLTEYMLATYNCNMSVGIEADDTMSIEQNKIKDYETVICSRDKDLRITAGWHYSWECGKSSSIGPLFVETLGHLEILDNGKLFGTGLKFFYAQMLMGDTVDNIQGIYRYGPMKAYELLKDCETEEEMFMEVYEVYYEKLGKKDYRDYYKEQAALLWMVQELDNNNNPVHHVMYDER